MDNLKELEYKPIIPLLWQYSLPAIIGMLVTSLYNVIDRIFIGQGVGVDAIAGLTITFPVMNITVALGVLIGAGAAARTSIYLGMKDYERADLVLGNSLVLLLINVAIYLSVFAVYMEDILIAFGASDVTLPYALEFMYYIMPGMLMTNLAFTLNNVMRASGYPKRAMVTMIIGAVFNVILAPIFIFVFDMGIKGAAIATDIAMTISAGFVLWHFLQKDVTVRFKPGIYRLRKKIVLSIYSIGASPALVNAVSCAVTVIINTTVVKYGGDMSIAAVGIFVTMTSLISTVTIGLCQGMQPIVGYNFGAGKLERLKKAYWTACLWATCLSTLGSIIGINYGEYVARLFTSDAELIDVTSSALGTAMLAFSVVGFQIVSTTFFQSIGKAGKSIFLSLIRQIIFLIPMLLILPRHMEMQGVWASFPISDLFATIVTGFMIYTQFKQISEQRLDPYPMVRD